MKGSAYIALCLLVLSGCGGSDSTSTEASGPGPADPPQNLTAAKQGQQAELSWDSVENAEGYHVYYSSDPDMDPDNYAASENSGLDKNVSSPHTVDLPAESENFFFAITAVGNGEETRPVGTSVVGIFEIPEGSPHLVRDLAAGIEWKRCAEGQSWSDQENICLGDPTEFDDEVARSEFQTPDAEGWQAPTNEQFSHSMRCRDNLAWPFNFREKCEAKIEEIFPNKTSSYPPYYVRHSDYLKICGSPYKGGGVGCSSSEGDRKLRVLLSRPIN